MLRRSAFIDPSRSRALVLAAMLFAATILAAGPTAAAITDNALDEAVRAVEPQLIAWRRDLHQHPELGNREFRTAKIVAEQLESFGLEVKTGIAHTGVVGILRGGKPGPVVALRADMDALPVTEQVDLPFKSTETAEYRGERVGVMHACGHDAHTAILLSAARVLSKLRAELPGTVIFVFQPAEEGPPEGERGGAVLMLEEGLFDTLKPDAMFGLHVFSTLPSGTIGLRAGPTMAAADRFRIVVKGRQTHGARPWGGVDPIVVAAQVVTGLQTIVARQLDLTRYPAVLSVGAIKGGIRFNIIPDEVEMVGTIRSFDPEMRADIIERMTRTAKDIASSAGATAQVEIAADPIPVVVNDETLTARMRPTLERVAGADHVVPLPYSMISEDFSRYGSQAPLLFLWVGITPPGTDPLAAPANHSPKFYVDEAGLPLGLRAMLALTVDYLQGAAK